MQYHGDCRASNCDYRSVELSPRVTLLANDVLSALPLFWFIDQLHIMPVTTTVSINNTIVLVRLIVLVFMHVLLVRFYG